MGMFYALVSLREEWQLRPTGVPDSRTSNSANLFLLRCQIPGAM